MLGGDWIQDEYGEVAVFNSLSSNPATMEAAKHLHAYGLQKGYTLTLADAEQAYIQADLSDEPVQTWVRLPEECRPPEWASKYHDPVVLLEKALYGHPRSGGLWEQHCEEQLGKLRKALPSGGWLTVTTDDGQTDLHLGSIAFVRVISSTDSVGFSSG